MATRLYLHAASNGLSGTFPTGEQSSKTAAYTATGANTLRTMNRTKGSSQTSLTGTAPATQVTHRGFHGFFCSPALSGAQTVGGGTIVINWAASESNNNMNLIATTGAIFDLVLVAYVWRPSTGALIGYITDSDIASNTLVEVGTVETSLYDSAGFSSSAVNAADGDVIIHEVWMIANPGMSVSYNSTFYYDGTVETNTNNSAVTDHASYIEFAENLVFVGDSTVTTKISLIFEE